MENQHLSEAVKALEHSLNAPIAGREYAWAERVVWALASLEQTLLRLIALSEDQNPPFGRPDSSLPPLEHLRTRLRRESLSLLERCKELRKAAQNLAQPFTTPIEPALNPILEEGRRLLAALRQHLGINANLLLEDKVFSKGSGD